MPTELTGTLKVVGDADSIRVEVHLDREELTILSSAGELGSWSLADIGVNARSDGFHLRVEGEELLLSTSDDARFAMAIGLRSSGSPRLNRQMANANDLGPPNRVLPKTEPPSALSPVSPFEVGGKARPLGLAVLGGAAVVFFGGLGPLLGESNLRLFGLVPAWPVMLIIGMVMASGGISLWSGVPGARKLIGAGSALGLVALAGSVAGADGSTFGWWSDGVLPLAAGSVLCGLLLSLEVVRRSSET
jgi:hypothetical protein